MSIAQKLIAPEMEEFAERDSSSTSFTDLLRARRRAEIVAFLTALNEPSLRSSVLDDTEAFASVLDLAIGDYGVQQKEIADHLKVSPGAVGRWRSKEHAPRRYARESVLSVVAALIQRQLNTDYAQNIDEITPKLAG